MSNYTLQKYQSPWKISSKADLSKGEKSSFFYKSLNLKVSELTQTF